MSVASLPWVGANGVTSPCRRFPCSACPGSAVLSDSRRSQRQLGAWGGSCATAAFPHYKWPWGWLALGMVTICLQLLCKTVQKLLITVVFKWQLWGWWLVATEVGSSVARCLRAPLSAVLCCDYSLLLTTWGTLPSPNGVLNWQRIIFFR